MEVTAQSRPDGRHECHHGSCDTDVVESFTAHRLLHHSAPVEAQAAVGCHEHDGRRCGDLLGDAEQQSEHTEAADVEAAAGERREDAADDSSGKQRNGLPRLEVVDLVVRLSLVIAVEQEQCESEREPDRDEAHLLLNRRQPQVHGVEATQGADCAAGEAQHDRVILDLYFLQHNGHGGCRHAARLHHKRDVPSDSRSSMQRQRQHGERHGTAAFTRHTCKQREPVCDSTTTGQ